jgi:hypothetical protein
VPSRPAQAGTRGWRRGRIGADATVVASHARGSKSRIARLERVDDQYNVSFHDRQFTAATLPDAVDVIASVTDAIVPRVKQLVTAALARLGKPGSHADIATRLHGALTAGLKKEGLDADIELVNDALDIWVASRDIAPGTPAS